MEDKRANGADTKTGTRDDSHLGAIGHLHPSVAMHRPQTRERSFSVDTRPPIDVENRRRCHTMAFAPLSGGGSTTSSPDIRERVEPREEAEKTRERPRSQQLFGGRAKSKPSPGLLGLGGIMVGSAPGKKKRLSSLLFGMDTDKNGEQGSNETGEPEPDEEEEMSPWGEGLELTKDTNGNEYCKAGSLGKLVEYLLKKSNGNSPLQSARFGPNANRQ